MAAGGPEAALVVRMEATLARFERQLQQGVRVAKQRSGEMEQALGTVGSRMNLHQVALQLSQVGQSAQVTGNTLQALAIQLPDLALGFGPVGIAVGAVAGGLLTYAANVGLVGNAHEALQGQLDDLAKQVDTYRASVDALNTSQEDLIAKYPEHAAEAQRLAEVQAEINRQNAQAAFDTARGNLPGVFQLTSTPQEIMAAQAARQRLADAQRRNAVALDAMARAGDNVTESQRSQQQAIQDEITLLQQQQGAYAETRAELTALAESFNNTNVDNVERFAMALAAAQNPAPGADMAGIMQEVQDAFLDLVSSTGQLTQNGRDNAQSILDAYRAALDLTSLNLQQTMRETADQSERFRVNMQQARDAAAIARGEMINPEQQFGRAAGDVAVPSEYTQAAAQGLIALIRASEGTASTYGYNTTLAHGRYRPEGADEAARPITTMTMAEILALQRQMLADPRNARENPAGASSALGMPQVVASTLFGRHFSGNYGEGVFDQLRLNWNDVFDVEMQNRIMDQLLRQTLAQGGDPVANLRNRWQGLEKVPASLITQATGITTNTTGGSGLPGVDPQVARADARLVADAEAAIARAAAEQQRAREAAAKENERLDEAEAKRLADIAMQRQEDQQELIDAGREQQTEAEFQASLIGRTAREVEYLTIRHELLNQAREKGVDLGARVGMSEETIAEMIDRVAASAANANVQTEQLSASVEFQRQQWQDLENGILDAIVAGESFTDTVQNIVQALARATLQAALFGNGPLAGDTGPGGLLGAISPALGRLFSPGNYEGGGHTWAGPRVGGVDGRGGRYAILHPDESVLDHRGGTGAMQGGGDIRVWVDDDMRLHAAVERTAGHVVRAGIASYDQAMPRRVKGITRDPRRT